MDWVPAAFYGDSISVAAVSTAYIILYPLPDYTVGNQELLMEDEDEVGLYLERLVGDVRMFYTVDGGIGAWQLMPMGVDYETPAVLRPYTTEWSPDNSEWANLRWWTRRHYAVTTGLNPDLIDHFYWIEVDINLRQALGAKRNLWSVLVIRNIARPGRCG